MAAGGAADEAGQQQPQTARPLYLGVDMSTQSVTLVFLEAETQRLVHIDSLNFDEELPKYDTSSGMHVGKNGKVTSPVQMWLEGLDRILRRQDKAMLSHVQAVSGAAQQHGSVFWNAEGLKALRTMAPEDSLAQNLYGGFSMEDCPIWADSSTQDDCQAMEAAVGGAATVAALTGSRAYCRFTGPQIAKLARKNPLIYKHTARISLVSSFLTSLLLGRPAPMDTSDASGMNLLNIRTKEWCEEMLDATAPGLASRLGAPVKPWESLGPISPYCAARYGFTNNCLVVPATGDNPCALVGLGLTPDENGQGTLMVSLGTSDTLVGLTSNPHPGPEGHVMVSPRGPEEWFVMLCYKNGSIAREAVRDRVAGGDWQEFSSLLRASPPGNDGCLGLTLVMEETVPVLRVKGSFRINAKDEPVAAFQDAAHEVRAVVEARFLSMKAHAQKMGLPTAPARILATGGGSENAEMMQVLADVFGAEVIVADTSNAAALGAALRAAHGVACRKAGKWIDVVAAPPQSLKRVAVPKATDAYGPALLQRLTTFEGSLEAATTV